jgi:hypothetical protein
MASSNRRRSPIGANDLAGYGSVANGTVNVDRAARGLGASKTEVRQAIRQAEAAQSNTFYRRISGRREADFADGGSRRAVPRRFAGHGAPLGCRHPKAVAGEVAGETGDNTAGGAARHNH